MTLCLIGWRSRSLRCLLLLAALGAATISMTGCAGGARGNNMPRTVDEWMAQPRLDP